MDQSNKGLDKDHLTIDAFNVLADYSVYQRFDNFNRYVQHKGVIVLKQFQVIMTSTSQPVPPSKRQ